MKALIILVAVMLPVATAASANRPGKESKAPETVTFKSLDRDGDKSISKVEAKANRAVAANFDTADINLDGYISKSEYDVYLQRSSGAPPKQEQ